MVKRYDLQISGYPEVSETEGAWVKYEDYAALAAECAALKKIVDFVIDLDNEPQYHDDGMGCGLEDRNISSIYDAARYGWDEAMERIYGEVIPCADEIETPATDRFLAEQRAQGVEMFAQWAGSLGEWHRNKWVEVKAGNFAAELRNEVKE